MANYLYNGVELPELPTEHVYNEEGYALDYALIKYEKNNDTYKLYFITQPLIEYLRSSLSDVCLRPSTIPYYWYDYTLNADGAWEDKYSMWGKPYYQNDDNPLLALSDGDSFVWANHDIPDTDNGTIYLAKSDPQPIKTTFVYDKQSFLQGLAAGLCGRGGENMSFCPLIWNKVKNLQDGGYGYTESGVKIELFPETEISAVYEGLADAVPKVGDKITIRIDGEKYTQTVKNFVVNGGEALYIGNGAELGAEATEDDFFLCFFPFDGGYAMVICIYNAPEGKETFVVSAYCESQVVRQIDQAYIPQAVFEATAEGWCVNGRAVTITKIKEIIANNTPCYFKSVLSDSMAVLSPCGVYHILVNDGTTDIYKVRLIYWTGGTNALWDTVEFDVTP